MTDRLRAEIKQRQPFTRVEEAFLNLLRTANLFEQHHARFFKPWGLTPTQYNALRILRGSHPGSLPCSEVGERMVTPVPDVTRLLDRLEAKGLVHRGRDPADRRVVRVEVSDTGLELLAGIDEPLEEWLAAQLGHLPDGELQRLSELLERARERLG